MKINSELNGRVNLGEDKKMRKIIITTTKIVHVQVLPDISDGRLQAIGKRMEEINRILKKRKRMIARWEKKKKKEELEGGENHETSKS